MVVISDLASRSLKDAVPPSAPVEAAALLARTTEGPKVYTQHTSRIVRV